MKWKQWIVFSQALARGLCVHLKVWTYFFCSVHKIFNDGFWIGWPSNFHENTGHLVNFLKNTEHKVKFKN